MMIIPRRGNQLRNPTFLEYKRELMEAIDLIWHYSINEKFN